LAEGVYRELVLTNRQYAFARILNDQAVLVAVNNDESPAQISIPVPVEGEEWKELFTGENYKKENGRLNLTLDACDSKVMAKVVSS
jgi:hypothetical protein